MGRDGDHYTPVTGDIGNYIRPTVAAVNSNGTSVPVAGNASLAVVSNGLLAGLFGYWRLNGDATDASGNGNDMSAVGTVPFYSDPDSGGNQVAYFDGTGDNYFDSMFSVSGAWTIRCMLWIPSPLVYNSGNPSFWNTLPFYVTSLYGGWAETTSGATEAVIDNLAATEILGSGYPLGQWVDTVVVNDLSAGLVVLCQWHADWKCRNHRGAGVL